MQISVHVGSCHGPLCESAQNCGAQETEVGPGAGGVGYCDECPQGETGQVGRRRGQGQFSSITLNLFKGYLKKSEIGSFLLYGPKTILFAIWKI